MPDWIPDNLAELVVFKPIRIVLLIIAAFVLRRVLHRLIKRSVRRAVDRPLSSRNQMAQKLIDATTLSAERRKQRLEALGSLACSTVTFVIFLVAILMILAEMGFNITTIVAGTIGDRSHVGVRPAEHCEGSCLGRLHAGRGPARGRRLRRHGEGLRGRRGHWLARH